MTTATTKPRKPTLAARLAAAEAERDALKATIGEMETLIARLHDGSSKARDERDMWIYAFTRPIICDEVMQLELQAKAAKGSVVNLGQVSKKTMGDIERCRALQDANKGEGR